MGDKGLREVIDKFRDALSASKTILISANCNIRYSGRAESFLADGDRIIIIKGDKTLLVHQPHGSEPINYMKGETSHDMFVTDGKKLVVKSRNLPSKEYMDIIINELYFMEAQELEDGQKLALEGTEADMSDMIYSNPELIEKGFKPISREEQTKYGFIDVFGYDKNNNLVIVECKRYNADLSAVQQLRRYVEKMKSLRGIDNIRGIIAAPKISNNALKMLEDWGFEYRQVNPPKFLERYDKDQKNLGDF